MLTLLLYQLEFGCYLSYSFLLYKLTQDIHRCYASNVHANAENCCQVNCEPMLMSSTVEPFHSFSLRPQTFFFIGQPNKTIFNDLWRAFARRQEDNNFLPLVHLAVCQNVARRIKKSFFSPHMLLFVFRPLGAQRQLKDRWAFLTPTRSTCHFHLSV